MSQILVARTHELSLPQARRLAERMAQRLRDEYGGSYTWGGDTVRFERTGASGEVTITNEQVKIRVDIGLLLTPLRSRIEREIHTFLDTYLAPDRKGSTRSSRSQGASRSERPN